MQSLIESASFMAHGYCLLWQPWLVVLFAGSDFLIFAAYSLIPLALLRFLRQRPDVRYRGLVALFAAFILLCGVTHLISIVTLWLPVYPIHGLVKLMTGFVSMLTAIVLFMLIPRLVAIPSPQQLEEISARLRTEIAAHEATVHQLAQAQRELEARVSERTAELEQANARLTVVTRETVHRASNLLTVVSSLARQTARSGPELPVFLDKFIGRLMALADATAAVAKGGSGASIDLRGIAQSQLAAVLDAYPNRVSIEGPEVRASPEAAQQLALALHELATNAIKYGALSGRDGIVRVSWREESLGGVPSLRLEWSEGGLPASRAQPNVSGGLGSDLLTRAVPGTLSGTGRFTWGEGVLTYVLVVPQANVAPRVSAGTGATDMTPPRATATGS